MTTPPTPQLQPAPPHPLLLLAEWIEAETACHGTHEASVLAVLAMTRVVTLDPAALRAQAAALAAAEAREEALRAALGTVLANHTYYGPDPGTYLLCCSCNGFVAFPGHSGTQHAPDCPVLTARAALGGIQ